MKNISAITTNYKSNHKDICQVRFKVFVDEQSVPEELEIDGYDDEATHVLIFFDDKAIGTGRILADGHIGRVAVLKKYRGQGVGKLIMKKLIEWAQENQLKTLWLSSQWHARGFYIDLDFACIGERFEEAGIDHIKMIRKL
jgi:predicted GNAT family N-acyltransferase